MHRNGVVNKEFKVQTGEDYKFVIANIKLMSR